MSVNAEDSQLANQLYFFSNLADVPLRDVSICARTPIEPLAREISLTDGFYTEIAFVVVQGCEICAAESTASEVDTTDSQ